jgi:hypothetical protein
MYIPRIGSRRAELIEIVNKSGGITVERLIEKHGMIGCTDITRELKRLVSYKCIKQIGNVFFPIYRDKPVEKEPENIVPSREPFPFKPLKTFPRSISPRGQPIEYRGFKTCKSDVKIKNNL